MKVSVSIIFFISTILWSTYCTGQTYSYIISDKTISSFIKKISKSMDPRVKKIDKEIIEWSEKDIYGERDSVFEMGFITEGIIEQDLVKGLFSPQDFKYITKQQENLEWPIWEVKNFPSHELIDSLGFAIILSKSYGRKKVGGNFAYSFSVPLFSLNHELAIVQQEYYCGFECMDYCILIYKKDNKSKNWEEIERIKCL